MGNGEWNKKNPPQFDTPTDICHILKVFKFDVKNVPSCEPEEPDPQAIITGYSRADQCIVLHRMFPVMDNHICVVEMPDRQRSSA